jgi:hypothetical protein
VLARHWQRRIGRCDKRQPCHLLRQYTLTAGKVDEQSVVALAYHDGTGDRYRDDHQEEGGGKQ